MRYLLIILIAALPFSGRAQQLFNADSTPRLQSMADVVVTGQYAPALRSNAVQQITVIDRKKIDAMAAQNLRDVLTNQLNIRLSQDPIFGISMSMQGSRGYGEDAKILIDGVPVIGKQNGSIDLAQINLANIERIEIIEGPMSVSYGTDAIAGTVNLITKKTQAHALEVSATTYYETIGTYNTDARIGLHHRRHTLMLNGSRNFFAGWNPGDGPTFFDFAARPADTTRTLQWKPREQYTGGIQYVYATPTYSLNYKGSYFTEVITNRGAPMLPYYEMAFDDYYHTLRVDNAIYLRDLHAGRNRIDVFVAYNAYQRVKNEYSTDLTSLHQVLTPGAQDTSKYSELNTRGTINNSAATTKLHYEAGYDIAIQHANSTQILNRSQQLGDYALFASAEYRVLSTLVLRPGLRYGYSTRYSAPLIPSVNLLYKPTTHWAIRASYAKGFREPNLKELYFDFVDINHDIYGNPNLKAEYSDNYSASAAYTGTHGRMRYKLTGSVFYNDIKDLITLASVAGGGPAEYTYVNIGRYKTHGAQLGAEATLRSLSIAIGGTCIGTYNELSGAEAVPQFSYSPEANASASYVFARPAITLSLFYKYTGRYTSYIADAATGKPLQAFMADYHTADVTASRPFFHQRLSVAAGCKNIFDVRNIAAYQAGGAHTSATGAAYIGTGRYYFIKLALTLHA